MKKFIGIAAVILGASSLLLFGIFATDLSKDKGKSKETTKNQGSKDMETKEKMDNTQVDTEVNTEVDMEVDTEVDMEVDTEENTDKVLIVYFSLTGNTRKVVNEIQEVTNGDVFEIQPDFNYYQVKSRTEMEELGKEQVNNGFKPEITNSVADIDSYDLIIIGSPVWWYSVTPPVMSFLSIYNLDGKRVAPFCTCGSDEGDFFSQFEDAIPNAEVLEGMILTEAEIADENGMAEKVESWISRLSE